MPEPLTIGVLALGGLGWLGGTIASGPAGNASDRAFCAALRAVKTRVAGLSGPTENHDVARAVRSTQIQALERLVRDYQNSERPEWTRDPHTRPEIFFETSLGFCRTTIGRCKDVKVTLNLEVSAPLTASIDGILGDPVHDGPAGRRAKALAAIAEQAVLDELVEVIDPVILPDGFDSHFREGAGGNPCFLELFGAYIAQQIKSNAPFRVILSSLQLARIEGATFDIKDTLADLESRFGGVVDELGRFRAIIDRLTRDLAITNGEKAALAQDLAQVRSDLNGTSALVGGFLETIVGRRVAPDQFSAMLFRAASDWKAAGAQIDALAFSANLSPRLAPLRDRAKAAHQAGRLDAAMAALEEISRQEADALRRLAAHETEIAQEMRLRRRGLAETRAAQAAVLRAQIRYLEAAGQYAEAARLLPSDDSESRWGYSLAQAECLQRQGSEFGDNGALSRSIEVYGQAAEAVARSERPLDWATTQNNLGNALSILEARESGTTRLEAAVAAYRNALEEWTRERVPLDWAAAQNNLGNALSTLGERESGTARLEEAVAAYRSALEESTRERVPLDWAATQANMGNALWALGVRESGTARLEEAVAAYRSALGVFERANASHYADLTRSWLAKAEQLLVERRGGSA